MYALFSLKFQKQQELPIRYNLISKCIQCWQNKNFNFSWSYWNKMSSWLFMNFIFNVIRLKLSYDKNVNSKETYLNLIPFCKLNFFVQFTLKSHLYHRSNHLVINYDIQCCVFYSSFNLCTNKYISDEILLLWTHIMTLISRICWFCKIHMILMKSTFVKANYLINTE